MIRGCVMAKRDKAANEFRRACVYYQLGVFAPEQTLPASYASIHDITLSMAMQYIFGMKIYENH